MAFCGREMVYMYHEIALTKASLGTYYSSSSKLQELSVGQMANNQLVTEK